MLLLYVFFLLEESSFENNKKLLPFKTVFFSPLRWALDQSTVRTNKSDPFIQMHVYIYEYEKLFYGFGR